jgi:multidrug efflux pump subunit AcrA (membrane-fusion protein)
MTMTTTTTELRNRFATIDNRKAQLATERDAIAYSALIDSDAKASKRLTDIAAEIGTLDYETIAIAAALAEAGRRAEAAIAAEKAEAERERARQAEPILKRLAARGKKLDEAMAIVGAEYGGVADDIDELIRLGIPTPSRDLVRVNLRGALDSATMFLDRTSRPIAPGKRRKFFDLTPGWARPGLNWINGKLNTAARDDAAA